MLRSFLFFVFWSQLDRFNFVLCDRLPQRAFWERISICLPTRKRYEQVVVKSTQKTAQLPTKNEQSVRIENKHLNSCRLIEYTIAYYNKGKRSENVGMLLGLRGWRNRFRQETWFRISVSLSPVQILIFFYLQRHLFLSRVWWNKIKIFVIINYSLYKALGVQILDGHVNGDLIFERPYTRIEKPFQNEPKQCWSKYVFHRLFLFCFFFYYKL